jgi:hypothetical protein
LPYSSARRAHAVGAGWEDQAMAIEALDVLYMASRAVEADPNFYRDATGAARCCPGLASATTVSGVQLSQHI